VTEQTTPARWSQRLHQIRLQFDDLISRNNAIATLPALHDYDYKFYLDSVLKINALHTGAIYYKGREIRKVGGSK
jgi:hypothetical protein